MEMGFAAFRGPLPTGFERGYKLYPPLSTIRHFPMRRGGAAAARLLRLQLRAPLRSLAPAHAPALSPMAKKLRLAPVRAASCGQTPA